MDDSRQVFTLHIFLIRKKPPIIILKRFFSLLSKAPCVEIIQRATSIIDYDQRAEKTDCVARVCPVLRELYGASEGHSVAWRC